MSSITTTTGFRITVMQGGSVAIEQGGFTVVLSVADVCDLLALLFRRDIGDHHRVLDDLIFTDEGARAISEWDKDPSRTRFARQRTEVPLPRCSGCGTQTAHVCVRDDQLLCPRCS